MLKSYSYFSDLTKDLNLLNNTNMSMHLSATLKYYRNKYLKLIEINIFVKIHLHLTHKKKLGQLIILKTFACIGLYIYILYILLTFHVTKCVGIEVLILIFPMHVINPIEGINSFLRFNFSYDIRF